MADFPKRFREPAPVVPGVSAAPRAPGLLERRRRRARLRQRVAQREQMLLELGALVFELHRQGRRAPELLQARAAELDAVDAEVRALQRSFEGGADGSRPAAAEAAPDAGGGEVGGGEAGDWENAAWGDTGDWESTGQTSGWDAAGETEDWDATAEPEASDRTEDWDATAEPEASDRTEDWDATAEPEAGDPTEDWDATAEWDAGDPTGGWEAAGDREEPGDWDEPRPEGRT